MVKTVLHVIIGNEYDIKFCPVIIDELYVTDKSSVTDTPNFE